MTLTELLKRATPLPWTARDIAPFGVCNVRSDNRAVAFTGTQSDRKEDEANAALITHAVNHLPGILESLEWITRCAKADGPHGTTVYFVAEEHMEKAKALVATAQNLDSGKEDKSNG